MKKRVVPWLLLVVFLASCALVLAQSTGKTESTPSASTKQTNLQEYVELLRTDIRQQKSQIMGSVMALDVDEAAKFWPIYSEYDAELAKLNDLRLANIQEYARSYRQMTDAKANELIQNALGYRKQRGELEAKYYDRVKAALGSIQAARFVQVEDQLLMLIDLQIASGLPIVGEQQ